MGFASLYPSCDRLTSWTVIASAAKQCIAANGEVDCFAALSMTWIQFAILRRSSPDVAGDFPPLVQRAQGRPGACCTRGLACDLRKQKCTGTSEASGFPARQANHPGLAAAADADPNDDSKRTIAILIALFGNQPNRDAREPPSSPPRRRDNLSGKPEDPDRTVQATLAMGPLPARRLLACHHRSRKVGSCGRIAGAWLRVRRHRSKGSSADVLSSYQSPDLRSAIAGSG